MNRKLKIAALCGLLAIIITAGGGLLWYLSQDKAKDGNHQQPPTGEMTGQTEMIYVEQALFEDDAFNIGLLSIQNDRVFTSIVKQDEIKMIDVVSGETAAKISDDWRFDIHTPNAVFDKGGDLYGYKINYIEQTVTVCKQYADDPKAEEAIVLESTDAELGADPQSGNTNYGKLMVDDKYIYLHNEFRSESGHFSVLRLFTHDGKLHKSYPGVQDFTIDDKDGIYLIPIIGLETTIIKKYDKNSGAELFSIRPDTSNNGFVSKNIAFEVGKNQLYVATDKDVQVFEAAEGKFIKAAMTFAQSAPTLSVFTTSMVVDSAESIYFSASFEGRVGVYKYELQSDTRQDIPCTLTITAPYRDDYMTAAVKLFENANKTQKIKYDYVYNSKTEFYNNADSNGYFDKMRLRLLSGNVGDIYMTGGQWNDCYSLFKSDMFMDITQLVKQDQNYKNIAQNTIDGMIVDGKQRGVAVTATYFYGYVNTALCDKLNIDLDFSTATWGDVLKLTEQLEGTDYYLLSDGTLSLDRIFTRMLISNMPDIIDRENKKVDLRQDWFLNLIEAWKTASRSKNFMCEPLQYPNIQSSALLNVSQRTEDAGRGLAMLYRDANAPESISMRIIPLFSGEKATNRAVLCEDMYSIVQWSKNKEVAWKFLSFLLSENVQSLLSRNSRPVNELVRQRETSTLVAEMFKDETVANNFAEDTAQLYSSADYMFDMNIIKEDLFRPLLKYINDEITLDEAVKTAEHDIWIRLNE